MRPIAPNVLELAPPRTERLERIPRVSRDIRGPDRRGRRSPPAAQPPPQGSDQRSRRHVGGSERAVVASSVVPAKRKPQLRNIRRSTTNTPRERRPTLTRHERAPTSQTAIGSSRAREVRDACAIAVRSEGSTGGVCVGSPSTIARPETIPPGEEERKLNGGDGGVGRGAPGRGGSASGAPARRGVHRGTVERRDAGRLGGRTGNARARDPKEAIDPRRLPSRGRGRVRAREG